MQVFETRRKSSGTFPRGVCVSPEGAPYLEALLTCQLTKGSSAYLSVQGSSHLPPICHTLAVAATTKVAQQVYAIRPFTGMESHLQMQGAAPDHKGRGEKGAATNEVWYPRAVRCSDSNWPTGDGR